MEVKEPSAKYLVRPGFKQTEVGVIPEDWRVVSLGSVIEEFRGGAPLKPSDFTSTGIRVLPKGGVGRTGWLNVSDEDLQYCSPAYADQHRRNQVDETFTIVVLRDLVPSGPSIGLMVRIREKQTWVLAQGVYGLKLSDRAVSGYLVQFSNTQWYRKLANSIMVGSTQVHITNTSFKRAQIPLPPPAEQEAIADVLSDADALIESLEQLLAKKRNLKQGAMQELLTGKKRLPGFSGEWEVKAFNDICWFQEGPGVRNTQFTASGVKLLNGTNIFRGVLNLDSTSRFISEREAFGPYAHFLADVGDIVIASSGITIERLHEKVAVVREYDLPFCMNTSTIRFKPFAGLLAPDFLFHVLTGDSFKRAIGGQATGSAQLNFGPSHVAKVAVHLPSYSEQTAIATILSDMDAEIAALEGKLAKARSLKQGMMQELLTGRIRLV